MLKKGLYQQLGNPATVAEICMDNQGATNWTQDIKK